MRSLFLVLTAALVMGLAFWAYRENYRTQAALSEAAALQAEIAELREALAIQRAEWAYLNRPERLRELALLNFPRLGLVPIGADRFGRIDQVAYPVVDFLSLEGVIDTAAREVTQ
jgi:hypothetical protein